MFLPWKDENPTHTVAWITVTLIVVNAIVYVGVLVNGHPQEIYSRYGLVPARLLGEGGIFTGAGALTLATSMFLHAGALHGLLHLASNLLYLWIFGNNIEAVLGAPRFLLFYGLAGLGGHAAHLAVSAGSAVPTVGASGAIAGVLGAYLLRYPEARVRTFIYLIFVFRSLRVPAAIVIGLWFLAQLAGGLAQLGNPGGGGVAWFEHLGGFVAGVLLFPVLAGRARRRVTRW